MSDPKGFLKYARDEARRRDPAERTRDWKEMYLPVAEETLRKQGARCMDCGVPFCQTPNSSAGGCPVENLIPDWNGLAHQGRWREALELLHSTNNFPEFTGRLCPAPCEAACVLGISDSPVAIRSLEWNIVDRGFSEGWVRPEPAARGTGKRVAIVGSGPAGLAAAQQLARIGHAVIVFERADHPGGLLRYGIPDFKMEKSVLDRRLAQLRAEGVEFRCGVEIGNEVTLEELREDFDAVCLTIGAEKPRDLGLPGRDLSGIHFAMDYLTHVNRVQAGLESLRPEFDARGRHVTIFGGGDTGSDCLGTAHRQGASSVTQIEIQGAPPATRSEETPWPAWPKILRTSHAHEEGGRRLYGVKTLRFEGEDGRVARAVTDSGETLTTDFVLIAAGFTGVRLPAGLRSAGLEINAREQVVTSARFETSLPGVFAAGDVKRGASLIVWAIAEGRKMAAAVDSALKI